MRAVGRHGCGTQFHSVRLHACRPKEGGRVLGPDPSYSGSFVEAVLAHPEVQDLHDLRTRESGSTQFIELHVEIDGDMTVAAAHEITDAIEAELFAAFPAAEVILHQEPAGLDDERLDHRIARRATA